MNIPQPIFTLTAIADATLLKGTAVSIDKSGSDIANLHVKACTSGIADGILTADVTAGYQCNFYIPGSFGAVKLAAAVTDLAIPLKATTGGELTPCDTDKDAIVAWPMQLASNAGSYISARIAKGYYTV